MDIQAAELAVVPSQRRLHTVDGLRGYLALFVVIHHLLQSTPLLPVLLPLSQVAVALFFVLSGLVLTRAWDGRFGPFLLRRFVRLWPTYATCLLAGYLVTGRHIEPTKFLWFPMVSSFAGNEMDVPIWSLFVEVWAMPFMPLFVFAAKGPFQMAAVSLTTAIAMHWVPQCLYGLLFIAGACLSGTNWRFTFLETRFAQWLGMVSYSLYLSHWIVLQVLPWYLALPAIPAVAWILWWTVERPSISWSRALGRKPMSLFALSL